VRGKYINMCDARAPGRTASGRTTDLAEQISVAELIKVRANFVDISAAFSSATCVRGARCLVTHTPGGATLAARTPEFVAAAARGSVLRLVRQLRRWSNLVSI
jgi:hypothetical protein